MDAPAAASIAPLICSRCGGFVERGTEELILEKPYCPTCSALPEVNYLEGMRRRYWGKRDAWAWFFGVGALFNATFAVLAVAARDWKEVVFWLLHVVEGVGFFLGAKWARVGMFAALVGGAGVQALAQRDGSLVFVWLVPLLVCLVIYNNTRNQLFFKVEPTPGQLRKTWQLYENNSVARTGFILSLAGMVFWPLGLPAAVCGVIGRARVDPTAHPPIGRKKQALTAILLGALETVATACFLVFEVLGFSHL